MLNAAQPRLDGRDTPARWAHRALAVLAGACLLTLAARTQVPFWPVPMTLLTLAVLGLGLSLGPRLAVASVALFLAAGAAGLPVFAGSPARGIGLAYLAGPTGGYLIGSLAAAALTGFLAQGRGIAGRVVAMLVGLVALFALGTAWLAVFVPADKVFALGVLPFLPGEAVKVAVLAALSSALAGPLARLRHSL